MAQQTTASSNAFGERVEVELTPISGALVQVQSGPLPTASGTAPPAYSDNSSVASILVQSGALGQLLATGLVTVDADSLVPGQDQVSAASRVENFDLDIVGLLLLLGIDADVIESRAEISGPCSATPVAVGSTTIEGGAATGLLQGALLAQPAPNTVLLDTLGIRVVVNEQILNNGLPTLSLTVNALHITLDQFLLNGLGQLSGDIVIAHSEASLTCGSENTADLSISKSISPDPAQVGQELTYTLTIANAGPDGAGNVTVVDVLPPSVSLVSADTSQGSCTQAATVTCALADLPAQGAATVTIRVTAQEAGLISNTASVSADESDPDPSNNSSTASGRVNAAGGLSADVSVVKSITPDPALVGQEMVIRLDVANAGPDPASDVIVSDGLSPAVSLVSVESSQGSCTVGATISCSLGQLAAQGAASVTIRVTAVEEGTFSNTATVSADEADPSPQNNSSTAEADIEVSQGGDLFVTQLVEPPMSFAGRDLTLTLTVGNGGNSTVSDIELYDELSTHFDIRSVSTTQGSCQIRNCTIRCSLGSLAPSAQAVVTAVIRSDRVGPANSSASVEGLGVDPTPENNQSELAFRVKQELSVAQVADGLGLVSTLMLVNPSMSETAQLQVEMFSEDGQPLTLEFNGVIETGQIELELAPLASVALRSPGLGDLSTGWVRIVSEEPVGGMILFAAPGVGLAAVPAGIASETIAVAVGSAAEGRPALAIANPNAAEVQVTITPFRSPGVEVAEARIGVNVPGHGKVALFLDEIIPAELLDLATFEGSVKIEADGAVCVLGLLFRPGEIATLTVTPLPPGELPAP